MSSKKHKIIWNEARFKQARAMKDRWQSEELTMKERLDELEFMFNQYMDGESAEDHLAFWLYSVDPDLFYSWTR